MKFSGLTSIWSEIDARLTFFTERRNVSVCVCYIAKVFFVIGGNLPNDFTDAAAATFQVRTLSNQINLFCRHFLVNEIKVQSDRNVSEWYTTKRRGWECGFVGKVHWIVNLVEITYVYDWYLLIQFEKMVEFRRIRITVPTNAIRKRFFLSFVHLTKKCFSIECWRRRVPLCKTSFIIFIHKL